LSTERKQHQPKIVYPAKLVFKIEGRINIFHDKQKLKQCINTHLPLQKILKGILHTEDENKHSHEIIEMVKAQGKTR
jgi:hypothetical protein